MNIDAVKKKCPIVGEIAARNEAAWENPKLCPFADVKETLPLSSADIDDAEDRLARFSPFLERRFPETAPLHGVIESPLVPIPQMLAFLRDNFGVDMRGQLLLKQDSHLAVSGSVKARGGIYEVLKHAEDLAKAAGLLSEDYTVFLSEKARQFFHRYAIHVGSTGNLGLSIGIMGAAIGFRTTVHMSKDAKAWKKELLRAKGVAVIEYDSDYSSAVKEGRRQAGQDASGYFVDDENSKTLFLGYAVAARRLKAQLRATGIPVDGRHPLFVYIPCGVGGAPGGITFGLKQEFGDNVRCFFAEPTEAPCMLLGLATGRHDGISVQDIGLSGVTAADGLAVGRPSKFVGKAIEHLVSGIATVKDGRLFAFLRGLHDTEGIFIEPSACAAFQCLAKLPEMQREREAWKSPDACHIVWATGGSMMPEDEKMECLKMKRPDV